MHSISSQKSREKTKTRETVLAVLSQRMQRVELARETAEITIKVTIHRGGISNVLCTQADNPFHE